MYKNKRKWIVCDHTGIILNDRVTIVDGYVEVKGGKCIEYTTDDPMNNLAKIKPWTLHNRIKYKKIKSTEPCKDKRLQGKHFISRGAMQEYLTESV